MCPALTQKTEDVNMPITDEEVRQLALSGNLVKAIKLYRASTGNSLKEAKEHVESLIPPKPKKPYKPPKIPQHMTREELLQEVDDWRLSARYDPTMSGPRFQSWDRGHLDRCRKLYIEGTEMTALKLPSTLKVITSDMKYTVYLAGDNPQQDGAIIYRTAKGVEPGIEVEVDPSHKPVYP